MPGFTIIYQYGGLDKGIRHRIERLEKASFRVQVISKTKNLMVLFREGNHYPYHLIDNGAYILIVEGRLYGTDIEKNGTFRKQCDAFFLENSRDARDHLQNLDGEYILYFLSRKGDRLAVLNDYLGRLPQYYTTTRQLIISRDIFILDKVTTGLLFDENSIYQYLRLGFPLGNRTLFHDIDRVPYRAMITAEREQFKLSYDKIDLEEMEGSRGGRDAPEALYHEFRQAIALRTNNPEKKVVSLSGGLDSRVILGEIEKMKGQTVDYLTFYYDNPVIRRDETTARDIGRVFNRSPQVMKLREWVPESFDELTYAKGGMNYLGMAFLISFLADAGHNYDLMITGDGGDKTLPYMYPEIRVKKERLGDFIIRQHALSTKKTLDSFLTTDVKAQEKQIRDYLESLPGSTTRARYKHFLFFERARHWLFEGEDRNRNYIWSTTPFYHPGFFRLAHSIPERDKQNFRLFRDFMMQIDERLAAIPNANWDFPLSDTRSVHRMMARQRLKMRFPFLQGKGRDQAPFHAEMSALVASLMHKGYGGQVAVYADRHDLNAASSETLFHLITLLKVSEMSWRAI